MKTSLSVIYYFLISSMLELFLEKYLLTTLLFIVVSFWLLLFEILDFINVGYGFATILLWLPIAVHIVFNILLLLKHCLKNKLGFKNAGKSCESEIKKIKKLPFKDSNLD